MVPRPTPNALAISATVTLRAPYRARAKAIYSGDLLGRQLGGRPPRRPSARAARRPTAARSAISSNSASAAAAAWKAKDRAAHKAALADLANVPRHRRTVGAATKQRIRTTLRVELTDAIPQGLATVNMAKLVKLKPGRRPKALVWTDERAKAWQAAYASEVGAARECAAGRPVAAFKIWLSLPRPSPVMVWTPMQTGLFLDRATGHRLYALYHVVAFRGLRRGEVCGLPWEDIDLEAATLTVRERLTVEPAM